MTRVTAVIMACVVCATASTGCEADGSAAATPQPVAAPERGPRAFDGYVLPMNATELRAPQNTFRVGGWSSSSSWTKLTFLAEDGAEIEEGEVVGRFEFDAAKALAFVESEIRSAEAQRDKSGVDTEAEVEKLAADARMKAIAADRAELDTLRRGVVAERDWQLSVLDYQQAEFDAKATQTNREAAQRALRAEANYQLRNVERAQAMKTRYETYKERFVVRAPHDGVLRHAMHRRRGRKIQKGDGMPAGMQFASLARDKAVWVQFFVPEAQWPNVRGTTAFVVEAATSKTSWPVTVDKVEGYPQEIGFLKGDDKLPNGREKAYVVWARFDETPEDLSAGIEVTVRLP